MARTPDPEIQERNKKIATLWCEGVSKKDLADQFGLDMQSIRKVLKKMGLSEKDRTRLPTRKALRDRRPLSNLHSQMGTDISFRRVTELDQSVEAFAKRVGVSRQRLMEIELGVRDATICELVRIATAIGMKLEDLVKDRKSWAS